MRAEGKGFAGREVLEKMAPGDKPQTTKTSSRNSKRPLVLTLNPEAREIYVDHYFCLLEAYREASRRYRRGELNVEFPPGTYRPPLLASILQFKTDFKFVFRLHSASAERYFV